MIYLEDWVAAKDEAIEQVKIKRVVNWKRNKQIQKPAQNKYIEGHSELVPARTYKGRGRQRSNNITE